MTNYIEIYFLKTLIWKNQIFSLHKIPFYISQNKGNINENWDDLKTNLIWNVQKFEFNVVSDIPKKQSQKEKT